MKSTRQGVRESLASPEVMKRLSQIGIVGPRQTGPDYAQSFLKSEVAKWGEVLRGSPQ